MSTRKTPYSPTVRRRRLSLLLRQQREAAGYTLTSATAALGWDRTRLSRIESGELKKVKPEDLDALLGLYGVSDPAEQEAMHTLAREAKQRGWWSRYRDVFGSAALPDFEAEASLIRTYEALTIPGLLQTPDYAEGVFQGGRYTTPERVRRQVEARMARREILTRFDSPPRLWAVIDEAALRRPIGSWEVMRAQLEYLLHIGQLPTINIQVLPFSVGSHPALSGPFTILEFPGELDQPLVYTDILDSGLFEEHAEQVTEYLATFSDVQGTALGTVQSARFIEEILSLESSDPQ